MKILVAIANHGIRNQHFLNRLIAEYRSMPWQVDIVVLSDAQKSMPAPIEVRVGAPSDNPWSLPFAHRPLFLERQREYDLFIYSEDDTLVRRENVEAFLDATRILRPNEIAGFMRTEADSSDTYVSSVHGYFHWNTGELVSRGSEVFVPFTNDHAACYLATRDQLARAIASGGFTVEPHQGRYDMLCAAATDIYTQCGLRRLICITRLKDFLLPHLPNKYVGQMGVSLREVEAHVAALRHLPSSGEWAGPLFNAEYEHGPVEWSKNLYENVDPALLTAIPDATRRLLSVGAGWGATELALAERNIDVTAVPLDPVFGDALRRRGIRTVSGPLAAVTRQTPHEFYDCILLNDVLHLVDDPVAWLQTLKPLLSTTSSNLVLSMPNVSDPVEALRSRFSAAASNGSSRRFKARTGVRKWLRAAGFRPVAIELKLNSKRAWIAKATLGICRASIAQRLIIRAEKD